MKTNCYGTTPRAAVDTAYDRTADGGGVRPARNEGGYYVCSTGRRFSQDYSNGQWLGRQLGGPDSRGYVKYETPTYGELAELNAATDPHRQAYDRLQDAVERGDARANFFDKYGHF